MSNISHFHRLWFCLTSDMRYAKHCGVRVYLWSTISSREVVRMTQLCSVRSKRKPIPWKRYPNNQTPTTSQERPSFMCLPIRLCYPLFNYFCACLNPTSIQHLPMTKKVKFRLLFYFQVHMSKTYSCFTRLIFSKGRKLVNTSTPNAALVPYLHEIELTSWRNLLMAS